MARHSVDQVRAEILRMRKAGTSDTAIAASLHERGWSRPVYAARWTGPVVTHFVEMTAPPRRRPGSTLITCDMPAPMILT